MLATNGVFARNTESSDSVGKRLIIFRRAIIITPSIGRCLHDSPDGIFSSYGGRRVQGIISKLTHDRVRVELSD